MRTLRTDWQTVQMHKGWTDKSKIKVNTTMRGAKLKEVHSMWALHFPKMAAAHHLQGLQLQWFSLKHSHHPCGGTGKPTHHSEMAQVSLVQPCHPAQKPLTTGTTEPSPQVGQLNGRSASTSLGMEEEEDVPADKCPEKNSDLSCRPLPYNFIFFTLFI